MIIQNPNTGKVISINYRPPIKSEISLSVLESTCLDKQAVKMKKFGSVPDLYRENAAVPAFAAGIEQASKFGKRSLAENVQLTIDLIESWDNHVHLRKKSGNYIFIY